MADMEHLFGISEIEELKRSTGRTIIGGMFKTALDRAEKAQYNMRVKIDKAEAERVTVYAERIPRSARDVTSITIYRKNDPVKRIDLSRNEALRLIMELKEALRR